MRGDRASEVHRLILAAAARRRRLTPAELELVIEHVAGAGFDPDAKERARGRLTGARGRGRVLGGKDVLPPAERHYLWHVRKLEEWPTRTRLDDYLESLRRVARDPASGIFINRYQGAWGLGVVRESRELRGPGGAEWVLIQYRLSVGHWVTAFQPVDGLRELRKPQWSDVLWLRRPRRTGER